MAENVKIVNDSNFQDAVKSGVTLVDFFAEWCGPCRMIAPLLEEIADEMKGKASIVKLDVDQSGETTEKFGVTNMPTLIVLKDGEEVTRFVGVKSKETLKSALESALS